MWRAVPHLVWTFPQQFFDADTHLLLSLFLQLLLLHLQAFGLLLGLLLLFLLLALALFLLAGGLFGLFLLQPLGLLLLLLLLLLQLLGLDKRKTVALEVDEENETTTAHEKKTSQTGLPTFFCISLSSSFACHTHTSGRATAADEEQQTIMTTASTD